MDVVTLPGVTDAFRARAHCFQKWRLRKLVSKQGAADFVLWKDFRQDICS